MMLVMLSTNCPFSTMISFIDMSRLTVIRWSCFSENVVPST